jgi:type II secretory pathway component PulF
VERGGALEVILQRARLVHPRDQICLQLAMVTGNLPSECRRQSERLVQDAHDMIARNERILRPLAILAVAAMGFAVLLAIYLPIFEIAMVIEGP